MAVSAGDFTVQETNLDGYTDVSDIDSDDANSIAVTLGEEEGFESPGNDFVDESPLGSISGIRTKDTIPGVVVIS